MSSSKLAATFASKLALQNFARIRNGGKQFLHCFYIEKGNLRGIDIMIGNTSVEGSIAHLRQAIEEDENLTKAVLVDDARAAMRVILVGSATPEHSFCT